MLRVDDDVPDLRSGGPARRRLAALLARLKHAHFAAPLSGFVLAVLVAGCVTALAAASSYEAGIVLGLVLAAVVLGGAQRWTWRHHRRVAYGILPVLALVTLTALAAVVLLLLGAGQLGHD